MSVFSFNKVSQDSKPTMVNINDTTEFKTMSINGVDHLTFRLQQIRVTTEGGFIQTRKYNAFMPISQELFDSLDLHMGQEFDGQIIREESHTPFYESQNCKSYPSNHATKAGQPFLKDGKKVYMQDTYTQDMTLPGYSFITVESTVVVEDSVDDGQF